jgi:DNA polymerase-4
MQELPVKRIWGIGPKSAARLEASGIRSCADLQRLDRAELVRHFGSFGLDLFQLCRGIDERPVESNRIRKSLSNERTFSENLTSLNDCLEALHKQHEELISELKASCPDRSIGKVFVKLKFADFKRTTAETGATQPKIALFRELLTETWGRSGKDVRLLGLGVRFAEPGQSIEQLELALR